MSTTHITHIGTSADPIEYLLTRKGEHASEGRFTGRSRTCRGCGYQFATPPRCWRCGTAVSW